MFDALRFGARPESNSLANEIWTLSEIQEKSNDIK